MTRELRTGLFFLALMTGLLGGVYPSVVFLAGRLFWPVQAEGNFVYAEGGRLIGARHIAQPFMSAGYFHPRPSATPARPYSFIPSGASNLNPAHPLWRKTVAERNAAFEKEFGANAPQEMTTASASGLDPHISPEAAHLQAARVAKTRGLPEREVDTLIEAIVREKTLGLLGQRCVNVLRLNLALDAMARQRR